MPSRKKKVEALEEELVIYWKCIGLTQTWCFLFILKARPHGGRL